MKLVNTVLLSSVSLLLATSAFAQSTSLQVRTGDLRVQQLQTAPEGPLANSRRERVSFSTAVSQDYRASQPVDFVARSREYRVRVSADQLQNGVAISTTGAGAVVTLSPVGEVKGAGLSPLDFSIETPLGNTLRGSDAMDQLVSQTAIKATGLPFSNGMVGFRLNRTLGDGTFTLSTTSKTASAYYQLHVLDAQGSAELSLAASGQVLVGGAFAATGVFSDVTKRTLQSVNAFLLAPGGERIAAKAQILGNAYTVLSTPKSTSFNEGLWELHVSAVDDQGLQRDVKTAFAAAYATARLDGSVEQSGSQFALGVETASSGRYEVDAVLYGTGKNGLVPVAHSATAQWLERGAATLTLEFDASAIKAAGVKAPFVLRSVTLKDQSRMSMLERVANAN